MGISVGQVSRHETGDRSISDPHVIAYARIFKIETYELFFEAAASAPVEVEPGHAPNGDVMISAPRGGAP